MHILHSLTVTLRGAHDADDTPALIMHGHLMSDEPIRDSLRIEEEFHDVEACLTCFYDIFIIAAEILCQALRKNVKILLTN